MLTIQKQFSKFANYWLNDFHFRSRIYQNFWCNKSHESIYSHQEIKNVLPEYQDVCSPNSLSNTDTSAVWSFLKGLVFPSCPFIPLDNHKLYWNFGKELSLNGKWIEFWKLLKEIKYSAGRMELERDFREKENQILSSLQFSRREIKILYSGCWERFLPCEFSWREKSIFLLGSDAINWENRQNVHSMLRI
jgi:hypothetical protein